MTISQQLALSYLEKQDLAELTPKEYAAKFLEIEEEIRQAIVYKKGHSFSFK